MKETNEETLKDAVCDTFGAEDTRKFIIESIIGIQKSLKSDDFDLKKVKEMLGDGIEGLNDFNIATNIKLACVMSIILAQDFDTNVSEFSDIEKLKKSLQNEIVIDSPEVWSVKEMLIVIMDMIRSHMFVTMKLLDRLEKMEKKNEQ